MLIVISVDWATAIPWKKNISFEYPAHFSRMFYVKEICISETF
jgi:hypothetical protein